MERWTEGLDCVRRWITWGISDTAEGVRWGWMWEDGGDGPGFSIAAELEERTVYCDKKSWVSIGEPWERSKVKDVELEGRFHMLGISLDVNRDALEYHALSA